MKDTIAANVAELMRLREEVKRLQGIVDEVHSWIVCACIATPEDMMGNASRIVEITTPKDV